jgi:transcriptional regulator with XRE-family HTH domain
MTRRQDFASVLRWWREHRRLSQIELAARARISQRHLSFLELGRASPSRDMAMRLAVSLEIPLRQQNAMLVAAGFAPVWRETAFSAPELAEVRRAIEYIMAQQEPFPAVVVDRHWNLLTANAGMANLVAFLLGPLPADAKVNLADALVAPNVLRPFLVNWEEVVRYFIHTVEADAAADGMRETAALLARLMAYKDVRATMQADASNTDAGPVLPMHFCKDKTSLDLFTTIATLGTPRDITAQELRIESFFPVNEDTARVLRGWGKTN